MSPKFRWIFITVAVSCLATLMLSRVYSGYNGSVIQQPKEKFQASPISANINSLPTDNLKMLTESLRRKIQDAKDTPDIPLAFKTCREREIKNYQERDCSNNKTMCLRTSIPENLESRIKDLQDLKFMSIEKKYRDVLQDMRSHVKGHYEFLILSGFSSNHYPEGQAQLKNYHVEMFPNLKVSNFSMIVYDIGLKKQERADLEKYCRCTVLSFPFDKFPPHVRNLDCFAWKMLILAAHIEQAEVIFWGDTSVRIKAGHGKDMNTIIERTKIRGVQQHRAITENVYHTIPSLFEAFGDSPCTHMHFRQTAGGWLLWHREPLILQALVEPVLKCALNAKCICPPNQENLNDCRKIPLKTIGVCNRNDQSAFTLIIARLFREKYYHFSVDMTWYGEIRWGNNATYFKELAAKEKKLH